MKKLFTFIVVALLGINLGAQTDQGTLVVGGNVGFNSSSNDANDFKSSSWTFGPEFGYFVADDLLVGIGLDVSGDKDESDSDNYTSTTGFGVDVMVRKYWMQNESFGLYGGASVGFGSDKETISVGGNESDGPEYSSFGAGVNAGMTFWPSSNIGLSAGVGVLGFEQMTNKSGSSDVKYSDFGLNVWDGVNFGFHWYFTE